MTAEKQQHLELLEVYQSLPALWDVNCEEYNDRNKKEEQYNILLECYNRHNPEGQIAVLRGKINSVRTNFRRELRKRAILERNVAPENTTFTTHSDATSFSEDGNITVEPALTLSTEDTTKPEKHKRKSDDQVYFESDPLQVTGDESRHIAKVWVEKLSKLNPTQKIIAEKVINKVFLKGQHGLLSSNTTLTHLHKQDHLNKDQFTQVLNHFLESDDKTVKKLHNSYLNVNLFNKSVE